MTQKKSNHRAAFATDPAFLARLAKQGNSLNTDAGRAEKPRSSSKNRLDKVRLNNMDSRLDELELDSASGVMTATFHGALLLSLNVMIRTHDAQGTALKSTWRKRVEALRFEHPLVYKEWLKVVRYPLIVEEVYITPESNLLDVEAVGAGCKPIIDAFVKAGFLMDDSTRYIAQPLPYTERGKRGGLILRFKPSPAPWGLIDDSTMDLARGRLA